MKDTIELRQSIIDVCLKLREQKYIFGTWGNVSVRLDDGNYLLTPSRVDYAVMKPEDLVVIDKQGNKLSGEYFPTSEREIHRRILNQRPEINAIIHTHSECAMACSLIEGGIPALSEEMCQLLGGGVELTSKFVPSDLHEELGETVAKSIKQANAILIRNHGPVCLGRSLEEAFVTCQILEKNASMYLSLLATQKPFNVLDEKTVKRGRDYFLNKYGKS